MDFCQDRGVAAHQLKDVYDLYAGSEDGLGPLIARLELRAGSPGELARRAGISPATLWEYRRGNFPLPLPILRRLFAEGAPLRFEITPQRALAQLFIQYPLVQRMLIDDNDPFVRLGDQIAVMHLHRRRGAADRSGHDSRHRRHHNVPSA